jgi:urease subunit alpha
VRGASAWRGDKEQLASKMKDQRGRLPEEGTRRGDNERIKR